MLVALTLGAVAAGSVTVAAQPDLTVRSVLAGVVLRPSTPPVLAVAPPSGTAQTFRRLPVPTTTTTEAPPPTTTEAVTTETTTAEPTTTTTVPPTTTTAAAPAPTAAATSQADRVVELVNAERRKAGCRPVTVDQRLVNAAQAHSTDMSTNGYFSHTSLDGRTFSDRIRAAGYPSPGAENIARGYRSAEDVMRGWMDSRGHRANILNCELVAVGVGLDTRGWYWTQDFGR